MEPGRKRRVPPITQRPESLHLKQTLKTNPKYRNLRTKNPRHLDTKTTKHSQLTLNATDPYYSTLNLIPKARALKPGKALEPKDSGLACAGGKVFGAAAAGNAGAFRSTLSFSGVIRIYS